MLRVYSCHLVAKRFVQTVQMNFRISLPTIEFYRYKRCRSTAADRNGSVAAARPQIQTDDDQPLYTAVNKLNRRDSRSMSTPAALSCDDYAYRNQVTVTSEGVAAPVKFVVRLVGSVPLSDGDREATSKFLERNVRRLCRPHSESNDDLPTDVVYFWPTVSNTGMSSMTCLLIDNNAMGTRRHSFLKTIVKFWRTRELLQVFFSNRVINRSNPLDQRAVNAFSINVFKVCLSEMRETRMSFFVDRK